MELKSSRHESVSAVSTLVWNWPLHTSGDAESSERVLYPWERNCCNCYNSITEEDDVDEKRKRYKVC